jgi:hypothetical protein
MRLKHTLGEARKPLSGPFSAQVPDEQVCSAGRTTKSLPSMYARRTTKSSSSKSARRDEWPSPRRAILRSGANKQTLVERVREAGWTTKCPSNRSTRRESQANATSPRRWRRDMTEHHRMRPRIYPHWLMGPINLDHRGLSTGVSTVTHIPEGTQQVHHTGVYVYAHRGWHMPVTTGRTAPCKTASWAWSEGPPHYYGGVSNGLAIGRRMTNKRDDAPHQEYDYDYARPYGEHTRQLREADLTISLS